MMKIALLIMLTVVSLPVSAQSKTLLILGDSLSASYGIAKEQGWVHLLEQRLRQHNHDYKIVNASISGETTLGAKVRLDELLRTHQPAITIVELGGNDGLRGISLDATRENLVSIVSKLQTAGSRILLVPMTLPPNYGPAYINKFTAIFEELGTQQQVTLSTFILEGIGDNPDLMQGDGIHPVADAQPMMLENLWPNLEPLLTD
jgi:acyl-CoA thioesterase-1